jgi:outer membrane receptor protein involved in Fe transport
LPDTYQNPAAFQVAEYSPSFFLLNAQVTRSFFAGLDVYLGVENLLNFRQENPILDPSNPDGPYFDSSYLWGPVSGRMVYVGMRWRI